MKAIHYFLVEVIEDYNNYEELDNGLKVLVNNTIETVENVNRTGTVVSAPKGTKAEKGDTLLFHHNICRKAYGFKGRKEISPFQIKPNLYYVPVTEIFMMKKPEGGWQSIDPFVFIEPIKAETMLLDNGLEVLETEYKGNVESVGKIAFINSYLKGLGLKEGDTVAFEEDSEHEYEIDGKIYYKMQTKDILALY